MNLKQINAKPKKIFVVGLHRSGTSILAELLKAKLKQWVRTKPGAMKVMKGKKKRATVQAKNAMATTKAMKAVRKKEAMKSKKKRC